MPKSTLWYPTSVIQRMDLEARLELKTPPDPSEISIRRKPCTSVRTKIIQGKYQYYSVNIIRSLQLFIQNDNSLIRGIDLGTGQNLPGTYAGFWEKFAWKKVEGKKLHTFKEKIPKIPKEPLKNPEKSWGSLIIFLKILCSFLPHLPHDCWWMNTFLLHP